MCCLFWLHPWESDLFHKAISQSGYTTSFTKEEAIGVNQKGIIVNQLGSDPVLSKHDLSGYGSIKTYSIQIQ